MSAKSPNAQDDNSDSESSEGTVLSSNESIAESVPEDCEVAKILDHKFHLPKDLCEDAEIFKELFSLSTWNQLNGEEKDRLSEYLPEFPENNKSEQELTITQLFNNTLSRFQQTPLDTFHNNLQDGNYRPDIAHYRKRILKAEEREQRIKECERISLLAEKLVYSREKLLRNVYQSMPGSLSQLPLSSTTSPKLSSSMAAMRASKRYFQLLLQVSDETNFIFSDEELSNERAELQLSKKQIKQEQDALDQESELMIVSTISSREKNWNRPNDPTISNEKYKLMMKNYRKRKAIEPDHPEMEINEIKLKDVVTRTNIVLNSKKATPSMLYKKPYAEPNRIKQESFSGKNQSTSYTMKGQQKFQGGKSIGGKIEIQEKSLKLGSPSETDEEDWIKANIIKIEPHEKQKYGKQLKVNKPTFEGNAINRKRINVDNAQGRAGKKIVIDAGGVMKSSFVNKGLGQNVAKRAMTSSKLLGEQSDNSFQDGDNSPELRNETQNCFLSLIRDIFCSTADHRIKLEELRRRINVWLKNPVAPTNSWYKQVDHWGALLVSAVHFLSGEFLDQPEDFVPYLEFKSQLNIYQWIGAGRDSDSRMYGLNQYWLSRHNEMGVRATNVLKQKSLIKSVVSPERNEDNHLTQMLSPPNPRCKSDWKVKAASDYEIREFQSQEKKRYENPYFPFTYRQHGYESVVGPIHGIHSPTSLITKARDHSILISDRPNFITTQTLVRDAVARLPNGEGSRSDICELIKCSQYIAPNTSDNVIQNIVSTALDRLCAESDPCVKFDNKRKLWVYVHRNRTEEEFERLHQQQGNKQQKKQVYRKINSVDASSMRIVAQPAAASKVTNKNLNISLGSVQKPLPALTVFDNRQRLQTQSSPPPLKISSKRYTKSVINDKNIEPIDVEASLDAHTMPIVKTPPDATRINLKASPQMRNIGTLSPSGSANQGNQSTIAKRSISPKITTTVLGSKKIISTNPLIIGQNQTPPLLSSPASGQSYLIPLNVSPSGGNKIIKTSEPPALTSTIQNKSPMMQAKNPIKVNTVTQGKSIANSQQTPKYIITAPSAQKGGKLVTIPRNSTPMLSQQKQILTNVIVQQQKAKSGQNPIILATNNQQKIPTLTISSSAVTSTSQTHSPQLIQLQQSSTSTSASNVNAQRQTVFQLKQLKPDGGHQTMILKPQLLKTSSASDVPAPPLVSVGKVIKSSGNSLVQQPQIITTTAQKLSTETTNSPIFARVVSAGNRQIIDGMLPKSSTTFKITGNNSPGMIQLAGGSQYAIVSKGKSIASLTPGQTRYVTTQSNINTSTASGNTQNIIIASPSVSNQNTVQQISPSTAQSSAIPMQQSLKIVQGGSITAQQLLNAKLINVQTLANKGIKTTGGIKMINSQNYITKGGVPLIIAGNKASTNAATSGQSIVVQANPSPNGTFILNSQGQPLRVQGNILTQGNVLNHPITSQSQTVVLGNKVLKVQPLNQIQSQKTNIMSPASSETMLVSTNGGKAISPNPSVSQEGSKITTSTGGSNQIILGSTLKVLKNVIKPNVQQQQTTRVVLASPGNQSGQFAQQIILPANFQGIKTLQGLKVIQQARLVPTNANANSNEGKAGTSDTQEDKDKE